MGGIYSLVSTFLLSCFIEVILHITLRSLNLLKWRIHRLL